MFIGLLPALRIYIVLVYPNQVLAYPGPINQTVQFHQHTKRSDMNMPASWRSRS